MRRVRELVGAVRSRYPEDKFFTGFEESCRRLRSKQAAYRTYEDALRWLDDGSWRLLKQKALNHFRDHRSGQLKQGFFNQLNEAFAYRHLVRRKHRRVRLLPETGAPMPDLEYFEGRSRRLCEVKTIGISDQEISRRQSREGFRNAYVHLGRGFIDKLWSTISAGRRQISAQGSHGLVYIIVNLDDIAQDHYCAYRRELTAFAKSERLCDVQLRFGVRFNRRMRLTCAGAGCARCEGERAAAQRRR